MKLKSLGKIQFDEANNQIIKINKELNLNQVEEYVYNSIVNGKINSININQFEKIVQKEAVNNGLLQSSTKKINIGKIFLNIFILILVLSVLFSLIFNFMETQNTYLIIFAIIISIIMILSISLLMFGFPVYIIAYLIKKNNHPYVRSEKGEAVNIKLEGLKNYLKEFSSLEEKC